MPSRNAAVLRHQRRRSRSTLQAKQSRISCSCHTDELTCHVLNPVVPACRTVCSSTSVIALVPPCSTCRLLSPCVGGSYMKLLWDGGGLTSDQHPNLHYPPTNGDDVARRLRTYSEALELGTAINSARVSYRLACTSCPISLPLHTINSAPSSSHG